LDNGDGLKGYGHQNALVMREGFSAKPAFCKENMAIGIFLMCYYRMLRIFEAEMMNFTCV
jgi:hypothetical protein